MEIAKRGLEKFVKESGTRKMSGLLNAVTYGRSVTKILQKLRSAEEIDFDAWYQRYREEMEWDPLMKFFYSLRNELLKEGKDRTVTSSYIRDLKFPEDLRKIEPPPTGTEVEGFFIGDQTGGTGYEIKLPDGSKEKYYVELPEEIGSVKLHFKNPPETHLGENVKGKSAERLCIMYIKYLEDAMKDAKQTFLESERSNEQ